MILRIKQLTLICGDIAVMYASLFAMIGIRYGVFSGAYVGAHLGPFSIIFAFWLVIFYIAGLYDLHVIRSNFQRAKQLAYAVFSGTILAIIIFYTIPYFHISPKRSLLIFVCIYIILSYIWRTVFIAVNPSYKKNIVIIGSNQETEELYAYLKANPQVGYNVIGYLNDVPLFTVVELHNTLSKYNTSLLVFAKNAKIPAHIQEEIYKYAARGMEVIESSDLYEKVFKKISLEFHENILALTQKRNEKNVYDSIKFPLEFISAALLFVVLLPFMLIVYILIRGTSKGPGIYKQVRYGKFQKKFQIYKFRTMVQDAEKAGAQWAQEHDPRITVIGKILRYTHIDEFPQLLNILKGDVSFVGPRPERPEFVHELQEKLPHYELRHRAKPGITGWAQINFKYGSSVDDARVKLQYDLYYIKHASFLFDMAIILKTLRHFFSTAW